MLSIPGRAPVKWRRPNRLAVDIAATVVAMLVVGAPALFTKDGFGVDFTNHLWLVSVQDHSIYYHHAATYFFSTTDATEGVFYPFFMFYGGTLYAFTGAIAAIIGQHVVVAYVGVIVLAIGASYGGLLWLGRQVGIRTWLAHAPAVTYVASAYFVTNLYGRGAWPEFIATALIPLLAASAWSLAYAPRVRLVPAVLFVLSSVLFSGSHNVTLLLGSVTGVVVIALLVLAGGRRALPGPARVATLIGLFLAALLVNAWFLLPDLDFQSKTQIGASGGFFPWSYTVSFNNFWVLFNPFRFAPKQNTTLFIQLPWLLMLWALLSAAAARRRLTPRIWRLGLGLLALWIVILLLVLVQGFYNLMPMTLKDIQFPYRLVTYLVLTMSGLVMAGALAFERLESTRLKLGLNAALGAVLIYALFVVCLQLWVLDPGGTYSNRDQAVASIYTVPATWYDNGNYHDVSEPAVSSVKSTYDFNPTTISSNTVTLRIDPPAGRTPFETNIGAGPYVVKVSGGARYYARSPTNFMMLVRTKPGRGPITVTIRPAGGPITTGRILTYVALIVLAVWFVIAAALKARRRLGGRHAAPQATAA